MTKEEEAFPESSPHLIDQMRFSASKAEGDVLDDDVRAVTVPDVSKAVSDWAPACAVETMVADEATYPMRESEHGTVLASVLDLCRALLGPDYVSFNFSRRSTC